MQPHNARRGERGGGGGGRGWTAPPWTSAGLAAAPHPLSRPRPCLLRQALVQLPPRRQPGRPARRIAVEDAAKPGSKVPKPVLVNGYVLLLMKEFHSA